MAQSAVDGVGPQGSESTLTEALALAEAGHQALVAGDQLQAEKQLQRAWVLLRRAPDRNRQQEAGILASLATLHVQTGESTLAVAEAKQMVSLLEGQPDLQLLQVGAWMALAVAQQGAGAVVDSRHSLTRALHLAEAFRGSPEYAAARLNLALWIGAMEDPKAGYGEAVAVMPLLTGYEQSAPLWVATAEWRVGQLALQAEEFGHACRWVASSLDRLRQLPNPPVRLFAEILETQGEALRHCGRKAEAQAAEKEAKQILARLPVWRPAAHRVALQDLGPRPKTKSPSEPSMSRPTQKAEAGPRGPALFCHKLRKFWSGLTGR